MECIIKYQKFHDLVQNWLTNRLSSVKKVLFEKNYFRKQLFNLDLNSFDSSLEENELISSLYKFFRNKFKGMPKRIVKIRKSDLLRQGLNETRRNIKFLRPVFELEEYVQKNFRKDEIFGFYIHGSISTEDYIENYSDLDTLVIIRKEVFNNNEWLKDLRKRLMKSTAFLYLLDPLQHHGHFVVTEYDMMSYYQFIFPLKLFEYSTGLTDFHNILEFDVVDSIVGLGGLIEDKLDAYRHRYPFMIKRNLFNSYQAKNAVQNILALPFLYAEMRDHVYYYKKDSFDLVKNDFLPEQWDLIERASRVRQRCNFKSLYPYWFRKFIGFNMGSYYLNVLNQKFDTNITKRVWQIMGTNFLREAAKFVEQIKLNLNI